MDHHPVSNPLNERSCRELWVSHNPLSGQVATNGARPPHTHLGRFLIKTDDGMISQSKKRSASCALYNRDCEIRSRLRWRRGDRDIRQCGTRPDKPVIRVFSYVFYCFANVDYSITQSLSAGLPQSLSFFSFALAAVREFGLMTSATHWTPYLVSQ